MILVDKKKIRVIHGLLSRIGMANDQEYKVAMVKEYSGGRETSTKGLSVTEAGRLISDLNGLVKLRPDQIKADQKRKRILHMAHEMMWYKDEEWVRCAASGEKPKVDMDRLNGWCVKYGQYHKALNEHTLAELSSLIAQFEKVHKDFLKSV